MCLGPHSSHTGPPLPPAHLLPDPTVPHTTHLLFCPHTTPATSSSTYHCLGFPYVPGDRRDRDRMQTYGYHLHAHYLYLVVGVPAIHIPTPPTLLTHHPAADYTGYLPYPHRPAHTCSSRYPHTGPTPLLGQCLPSVFMPQFCNSPGFGLPQFCTTCLPGFCPACHHLYPACYGTPCLPPHAEHQHCSACHLPAAPHYLRTH